MKFQLSIFRELFIVEAVIKILESLLMLLVIEALSLPTTLTLPATCHNLASSVEGILKFLGMKMGGNEGFMPIHNRI